MLSASDIPYPCSPVAAKASASVSNGRSRFSFPSSELEHIEQRAVHLYPAGASAADEPGADNHHVPVSLDHLLDA